MPIYAVIWTISGLILAVIICLATISFVNEDFRKKIQELHDSTYGDIYQLIISIAFIFILICFLDIRGFMTINL